MAKRKFTLTTTEVAELKAAYHQSKDANDSKTRLAVRLYGTGHLQSILDLIGCGRSSLMEGAQLSISRTTATEVRHPLQANAEKEHLETPLEDEEGETDEMFQNAGEKR